MTSKRTDRSSIFPVLLLVAGLVGVVSAGLWYLMYPSKETIAWYILGAGGALAIVAFVLSPGLLRDVFASRKTLLWVNDVVMVLAIIGIGVLLTHISHRRNFRYDFTRDQLFSISDKTIKVLRGLTKDVKVTAFYPTGAVETSMIEDLLKEYRRQSDRFSYRMVDPRRDPITTKAMNVNALGTVIVQCEASRKDIFEHEIFIKPNPYLPQPGAPKFQGEQALTSAVDNVTRGAKRRIQFVKGHGEPGLTAFTAQGFAGVQQYLVKENFDVSEVALTEGIASETQVLAIISPKQSFHPSEIEVLREFVEKRKGQLLVAFDPDTKAPELASFLTQTYGILFNAEILINPRSPANNMAMVVPEYSFHRIVQEQMERNSGVLMQMARGLTVEKKEGWNAVPFLKSPEVVYGKRNMDEVMAGSIQFNPQTDVRGPLNLGVAVEGTGPASGSRAVFFGDSDFASNMLLQVQGNADLLMNTFNWLAGEEEMISIRPKSVDFSPVVLDADAANRILILCVVVAPLLVLLIGGGVWWSRRRV
ncbi:MAG: GldG family protein [Candidatus Riflebacteria bacterium]|nr:GldG family protein [Candidatus Riflebacteria bacterium]